MGSLEDLIPTVNKLQDVMYDSGIDTLDLPILAVVGSQSSGKSSILETLVGRDFLPRGTGIVTRRPLVLQLNNISPTSPLIKENPDLIMSRNNASASQVNLNGLANNNLSSSSIDESNQVTNGGSNATQIRPDEWGEFLHIPGRRFYDFSEIRREIENETARIAGKNKGISKIPINLKIFSPHVLNLTLVDLPGITKVPIGEQPPDIEKQIKNLILDYVATPNCIILAVSPANVDLVNSESLKLAREVDPHGVRTIGVITKLDLMDSGTNALDILSGKMYPLKLGFVGVVNRSQQDIQLNKTVEEALEKEDEYFNRHPVYRTISHRCGTRYLAKLLNQTLISHIKEKLPDIKTRLNTLVSQTEQELSQYGDVGDINKENRAGLVLQLMNKFATTFISSIDGTSSEISTKELSGGARIYYIYNSIFGNTLKSIDPTTNLTVMDIRTAIRNSTGPRPTLFVPELAFDLLVKPQIKLLLEPSQQCVELVYEELVKICHKCGTPELSRYPKLKIKLIEVVSELLRERLLPTRSYVESLIDIHRAYINTNHPNFLTATDAMSEIIQNRKVKQESQRKQALLNQERKEKEDERQFSGSQISKLDNESNLDDSDQDDASKSKDTFLNYFFGKEKNSTMSLPNNDNNKFTSHPFRDDVSSQFQQLNFTNGASGHEDAFEHANEPTLTEREDLECELIRRLIVSYFDIVREMIQDQIPKAIMCLLVNFCKDTVQNRLVTELYRESMFEELLVEDQTLAQDRETAMKSLEVYKKASTLIGNIL
ncbi:Dynamin-related protein DNM1 [Nakaseomyces bracarensis]|uniref:Dynamin-related protein DNM1 n=1 Tax=Nakaseomyces bracarensis TaxID=273131 RepID=A0ABR4P0T4_9SACH